MTTVIAIAGHKGGIGKTCSALALAAGLARKRRRTLLVDCDPQAHATAGLGVEVADSQPTIRDLFSHRPIPIDQIARPVSGLPYLDVVPSDIRLERDIPALYGKPKREELLGRQLEPAKSRYVFVVLDCPPALNVLVENALFCADLVLVPTLMEAAATSSLIDLLELVAILKGEGFESWWLVLNKHDTRKSVTNTAIQAALAPWRPKILKTIIPTSESLNQACIAGQSIFLFDPSSKGAQAYEALTEEILHHVENQKT
jgi:chromosome partitioning protein